MLKLPVISKIHPRLLNDKCIHQNELHYRDVHPANSLWWTSLSYQHFWYNSSMWCFHVILVLRYISKSWAVCTSWVPKHDEVDSALIPWILQVISPAHMLVRFGGANRKLPARAPTVPYCVRKLMKTLTPLRVILKCPSPGLIAIEWQKAHPCGHPLRRLAIRPHVKNATD